MDATATFKFSRSRALTSFPVLQVIDALVTLRLLRRWRRLPGRRPGVGRMWEIYILPPLIPNLLVVALSLLVPAGSLDGFFWLFMPDFSWFAVVCGGFALAWLFLRTRLILWTCRTPSSPHALVRTLGLMSAVISLAQHGEGPSSCLTHAMHFSDPGRGILPTIKGVHLEYDVEAAVREGNRGNGSEQQLNSTGANGRTVPSPCLPYHLSRDINPCNKGGLP